MAIVNGVPTHRAVVQTYDGGLIEADQLVRYEGPPDWKYEPLNPADAARWREKVAQPSRVQAENLRTRVNLWPERSEAQRADEERMRRRAAYRPALAIE